MTSAALHLKHVCRELPKEILVSNVLPHLSMASLCRFQAICKTWNALLIQSDFAARHAFVSHVEEFVLISISLRMERLANSLGGWDVLDVANSKVFFVSHDLLATPARCGSISDQRKKILAANGGLLFVWYGNRQEHSLVVCNPILKVVKVIPSLLLQDWARYYNCAIMSMDTVSMEYEIVVIHPMDKHYHANCMDVFESKTGRWRRLVNTSVPSHGRWFKLSRFVKFKSASYRLYISEEDMENLNSCLIKYDQTTGMGSILDFPKPYIGDRDCLKSALKLVVSGGQLFCICRPEPEGNNIEHKYVEIVESFLEQRECKSLVRMPAALLHWLEGYDLNPTRKKDSYVS